MALIKKQTNNTRLIIIVAVVLAVAGGLYFIVQNYLSSDGRVDDTVNLGNRRVITDFGEEILDDPRYQQLEIYGRNVSVDVNTDAGNPNPFQ